MKELKITDRYHKSFIGLMEQNNKGEWCKAKEANDKLFLARLKISYLESDLEKTDSEIASNRKVISILTYICGVSIVLLATSLIKLYTIS